MSLIITDDCINCSACETECPVRAIFPKSEDNDTSGLFINNNYINNCFISESHYYINAGKCNECAGYYSLPRCNMVCPVSCCLTEDDFFEEEHIRVKVKPNPLKVSKISLN